MTMTKYRNGPRTFADYLPSSSYSAGDVIVVGGGVAIADVDNPPNAQDAAKQGALCVMGGVYVVASDAAYANLTYVYWDTAKTQITTDVTATAYPFGWIVGGATYLLNDAGPTGAAGLCAVLFDPQGLTPPIAASLYDLPRNMLDGGDMTINPAQRGTSQAADIANTLTYGPDRWAFKGGASSAINWSINADTNVAGFSKSFKFQRKSANTDTAAISLCQALETVDSVRTQGQTVTFSFYAKKGANYSGGSLTVQVESGQGTDQSASNLIAGSWTSQAHVINATQALTTTMTRYQFTAVVPAATTQLGVIFQWTPTGTAGADDSITLNGIQLEVGNGATPFEHRDVELELALCQRYYVRFNEPASGVVISGAGMINGTNVEQVTLPLPTTMRAAPTVTVSAGSLKFNIAGTATAVGGGFAAGTTHTPTMITVVGTVTATNGQSTALQGGGGAGYVDASADL